MEPENGQWDDWDEPTRGPMLGRRMWRWGNAIRTYAYDMTHRQVKRQEARRAGR